MECYIPGSGGKISVIMTAAVALAGLAALVAGCLGEFSRFGFQQLVERLLHTAADQLLDLPLDYFLVELYNVVGHGLLSPFRMCVATSFYQRPASRVYFLCSFQFAQFIIPYRTAHRSVMIGGLCCVYCFIRFSSLDRTFLKQHFFPTAKRTPAIAVAITAPAIP